MHGRVVAVFWARRASHTRRLRSAETLDGGHERPSATALVLIRSGVLGTGLPSADSLCFLGLWAGIEAGRARIHGPRFVSRLGNSKSQDWLEPRNEGKQCPRSVGVLQRRDLWPWCCCSRLSCLSITATSSTTVCLGLAVAGAWAVASGNRRGELLGSVLFSLSLNFKQMALYYACAFFFFLLASCVSGSTDREVVEGRAGVTGVIRRGGGVLRRVLGLGVVVLLTFGHLWALFCFFPGAGDGSGCLSSLGQAGCVRLFPFSRGLFEDKFANLWFCADVVFKLRKRLAVPHLAKLALVSTLSFLVPMEAELFRPGRPLTARRLVLALFNSSMASFLCSFQVHEKSLLLPLCPLAFLWGDAPLFTTWLQVIGVFSMMPLLSREGFAVPCFVCTMLYVGLSLVLTTAMRPPRCAEDSSDTTAFPYGRCLTRLRLRAMVAVSFGGVLLLLLLEAAFPPPEALPFLHPTLNALYSCANLVVAYVIGVYWQWEEGRCNEAGVRVGSERHPSPETEMRKSK
ncbi:unnamed protein product [Pylaiella littoralis]